MIADIIIQSIETFTDERGWLKEVYRSDSQGVQAAMSYVSFTKCNVVRGPHEHTYQSDLFVFIGPGDFELHLWDNRPQSSTYKEYMKIIVGETNPCSVLVPPGVVHGYKAISENGSMSINLPDKLYKGFQKQEEIDEIRHEQDPNSPYKIIV